MNKRLTKFDYALVYFLILLMVFSVGSFFFGVSVGKNLAVSSKGESGFDQQSPAAESYPEQDLVSFYHNIYLPYREFQKEWLRRAEQLQTNNGQPDAESVLNGLENLVNDRIAAIEKINMPKTSPLLQDAHRNILGSLLSFKQGIEQLVSGSQNLSAEDLKQGGDIAEGKQLFLRGQASFYEAILRWADNQSGQATGLTLKTAGGEDISITDWRMLTLNEKNAVIAGTMVKLKVYSLPAPQDYTNGIDSLIRSGQADKLRLGGLEETLALLIATNAVRSEDFLVNKGKWYGNEVLPLIPFFSKQD